MTQLTFYWSRVTTKYCYTKEIADCMCGLQTFQHLDGDRMHLIADSQRSCLDHGELSVSQFLASDNLLW